MASQGRGERNAGHGTGLVESSQQEIDEVVRIITERAASFNVVPVGYTLTVVTLTDAFRSRLGAELKSLASKNKTMGQFLRHVRAVSAARPGRSPGPGRRT